MQNSKFWIMCGALKDFVDSNDGQLPVRGVLPDMVADSEKYISLQNM
jgi:amyloid beta precursor protein binding protein 1